MPRSWLNWMMSKTALARRLNEGECGGDYAEAIIILSSAISAVAAESWPGERIDRRRFVELLKNGCDPQLEATRISVPLLIGHLRRNGRASEEQGLRSRFLNYLPSRILTGDEVDQPENAIRNVCPTVSRGDVREFSYANVVYRGVRSALVHQYRMGAQADPWPLSDSAAAQVSYGNWYGDPDRHIHFPVGWLCKVAESVASWADARSSRFPLPPPAVWWIDEV